MWNLDKCSLNTQIWKVSNGDRSSKELTKMNQEEHERDKEIKLRDFQAN